MSASPEYVVLGGRQHTRVNQGDEHGSIIVAGSTKHYRDPSVETERERQQYQAALKAQEREERIAGGQTAWCSHKRHEGDRELPIERFSKDSSRASGHHAYCKKCRALARVEKYAVKAAAEGRTVRGEKVSRYG